MSANPIRLVGVGARSRRELLWLKEGKTCHWCHCPTRLIQGDDWDQATTEHIIPRYKGGTNDPSNLTSSCRRCNSRRNHEDACGLPEGAMLGKYKVGPNPHTPSNHVALTKDDKKALANRQTQIEMLTTQRDHALREISALRDKIGQVESEGHLQRILLKDKQAEIESLKKQVATTTMITRLRRKLANWLSPENK